MKDCEFRVLGFRAWGFGFGVWGLGFRAGVLESRNTQPNLVFKIYSECGPRRDGGLAAVPPGTGG